MFLKGLAQELSRDGACEKAIFPDTNVVATRCAMIGNLSVEGVSRMVLSSFCRVMLHIIFGQSCKLTSGSDVVMQGDRCNLDFVVGCTDPSSPLFNPLANVDDGSCPLDSDSED